MPDLEASSDPHSVPRRPGFAVVGLGKMGIMHASMLRAIPGAGVAALVDRDATLCRHVASMGIPAPTFTDLGECLRQARPEGVVIATPQFLHRPMVELCLEHGTPVLCEKPLAHTLDDARAIARAAARHPDVPVAVGYMLSHNPLFAQVANLLSSGAIGAPKTFHARCRLSQVFAPKHGWTFTREQAGGGVLINSGCHLLGVLDSLFGSPAGVFARGSEIHNDVEDAMAAILDYPSNLWGSCEIAWSVPGHDLQSHEVEIIGTAGTLEVGNDLLRLWTSRPSLGRAAGWETWRRAEVEPRAAFSLSPDYCGDEFYLQMIDFIEAVRTRRPPAVGIDRALRIQHVIDALYRSMAGGRRETLPSPPEAAP